MDFGWTSNLGLPGGANGLRMDFKLGSKPKLKTLIFASVLDHFSEWTSDGLQTLASQGERMDFEWTSNWTPSQNSNSTIFASVLDHFSEWTSDGLQTLASRSEWTSNCAPSQNSNSAIFASVLDHFSEWTSDGLQTLAQGERTDFQNWNPISLNFRTNTSTFIEPPTGTHSLSAS